MDPTPSTAPLAIHAFCIYKGYGHSCHGNQPAPLGNFYTYQYFHFKFKALTCSPTPGNYYSPRVHPLFRAPPPPPPPVFPPPRWKPLTCQPAEMAIITLSNKPDDTSPFLCSFSQNFLLTLPSRHKCSFPGHSHSSAIPEPGYLNDITEV